MNNESYLTIGFAGDVMIGRIVNEYLESVQPSYIWGNVLSILQNQDVNIINLEAALTVSDNWIPKVFNFKSDPKNVQALIDASIDAVNLANNHVLDYSVEGLMETLQTLDRAGIQHVGAGRNRAEARQPVILTKKGVKIGILGYTDNEPSWLATEHNPGIHYIHVGDLETVNQDLISLRQEVDLLIVSIHWGPNMRERPTSSFRQFAHQLIDLGVDIIHGHSAHIFQGVEVYNKKLILYDTGDFVDDYYVDPILRNDRSFFFIVQADKRGLHQVRLIPVLISNFQVNLAPEKEADKSLQRMKKLSAELGTPFEIEHGHLVFNF